MGRRKKKGEGDVEEVRIRESRERGVMEMEREWERKKE